MRFVLMTALRETRSAWKRLIFFFICIAIGVGAIVALRSVIQSVRHVLAHGGALADGCRHLSLNRSGVADGHA